VGPATVDEVTEWTGALLARRAVTRRGLLVGAGAAAAAVAAYGDDVFTWARVVPVTAPVTFDLVLAPIGDRWSVIGAVQASPSSSS